MSQRTQKTLTALFLILALALWSLTAQAAEQPQRHEDLPLSTSWGVFALGADARAQTGIAAQRLAVLFIEPDRDWYTYAHEPGGLGKPTVLSVRQGGRALPVIYPKGEPKPDPLDPGARVQAYPGRTPLFIPLPGKPGEAGEIAASLELLLCTKDKCLPAKLDLAYKIGRAPAPDASRQPWWPKLLAAAKPAPQAQLVVTKETATPLPAPPASAEGWSDLSPRYFQPELEVRGMLKAALLGLLAGFILNFMPCVLPVVSIKLSALMSGSREGDEARRRRVFREHNLFFSAGVLLYFLILSAILGISGMAWGQIFQKPAVVLALATLVFALGLSLFGVFSLPVVDLKFDRMATHPKSQALFTGLLATLLATPCSGPFLGGVLGWTLMQPPWVISAVLCSIGLGMTLPYLVMTAFPGMVRLFPKPGPWTGHLEKLVGLTLMGTCIYLLTILPDAKLIPALVLFLLTAVAAWLWGAAGPGFEFPRVALLKVAAVILVVVGVFWALRPAQVVTRMDAYTEAGLKAVLGQETVVVDFTADWCPSCKVLEQTTLTPAHLGNMKSRYGLKLMQADLTEKNPEAEALLRALGSKSIPVLAIFPKNDPQRPLVLRDLFTPTQLEEALKQTKR